MPKGSMLKQLANIVRPNTIPKIAPAAGPKTMAPITTGTGIRVMTSPVGVGKDPSGVNDIRIITATKIDS
jgi:hypothetical protein